MIEPRVMPPQPLRVLVYIKNLNGGGAERAVVDLVNGLDRHDFEPKLLLGEKSGAYVGLVRSTDIWEPEPSGSSSAAPEKFAGFLRRLTRPITNLPEVVERLKTDGDVLLRVPPGEASRRRIRGLLRSRKLRNLRRAIREFRPDVLVSSLLETSSLHVWLARLTSPAGSHFPRWIAVEQNNTLARIDTSMEAERRPFWRAMTTIVYQDADAVVAVSKGVRDGLVRHFAVDAARVTVIPNHVDLDQVQIAIPIARPRPFVLAAGRLHAQKNFEGLIEAFAPLAAEFDVDLLILGEGEERSLLEQTVSRLGLHGRVHLPGFRDELWGVMKTASCFVLSSRFEGMPLTLLEAMGAGCPVVSVACDYGPAEVVTHGVDGLLVPPGDLQALSGAMRRIFAEPGLAQRMAEAGQVRAAAFERSRAVREYERLIRTVAGA